MNGKITEIKDFNNLVDYFTPNFETDEDLLYNFSSEGPEDSYQDNMKYHKQTECNVLKCFEIKKIDKKGKIVNDREQKFLKTETFQSDAFSDNYNISNILTNSPLTVYSNHEEIGVVESHLLKNSRSFLIYYDDEFDYDRNYD